MFPIYQHCEKLRFSRLPQIVTNNEKTNTNPNLKIDLRCFLEMP